MRLRHWKPLNLTRRIAQQLLMDLISLKSAGIVHGNITQRNIMLLNHNEQPFNVRLIHFKSACKTSKVSECVFSEPCRYTAPEFFLDLPLACSLWGLGCTLVFLHFGRLYFCTDCEYNYLKSVLNRSEQIEDNYLSKGRRVRRFFKI